MTEALSLRDLELCFEGVVPAVIATAASDGTPNITYLSRVRMVDDERVALSNQFFSKTSRNLAENPRGSVLLVDPVTYDMFRLTLAYERTERRGEVFERLREDVDAVAALEGMQDVFKLRAADVYRVLHIEHVPTAAGSAVARAELSAGDVEHAARLAELSARLSRCPDLDTLVSATVDALCELLGYEHSLLLLVDEQGKSLYTIASTGYDAQGVGSEIPVGEGIIGMAAARCKAMRLGNLRHMSRYSQTVRRSYEDEGHIGPGREIPLPGLQLAESRVAVPAMAFGQLVGVLVVESAEPVAFTATDESLLTVIASVVAHAIEVERTQERAEDVAARQPVADSHAGMTAPTSNATHVRFFAVDGSTFLDGDYLIKGVSGRILWSLLGHHDQEGRTEFTNREMRLDPALELPEFRDNFESRLILLKRRLGERGAPIRIEKTGRGRFRLVVEQPLRLEQA
jgi:predicted pyridoxine 5'-phosphate oxidase superfamily flavin-nucleotide-binding protein